MYLHLCVAFPLRSTVKYHNICLVQKIQFKPVGQLLFLSVLNQTDVYSHFFTSSEVPFPLKTFTQSHRR